MRARELPAGTVTFLFTDVERSTDLLRALKDRPFAAAIAEHRRIIRDAFGARGGVELRPEGDALIVAFPTATGALAAAVDAQRSLLAHRWPERCDLRVRMGLHTGEVMIDDDDYVGLAVHEAARIAAAAHGGQILVSKTARDLVGDLPPDTSFAPLGAHRLKDFPSPVDLFEVRHPDLPANLPPPRTLSALPNNLPIQVTSFIGREDETAQVTALLATTRILTLTGPGGAGKTRLALRVAEEVVDTFPDGAWFADLSPVAQAELVASAVAGAVGAREEAERPVEQVLASHCRSQTLLFVLDNCEHVIDTAAHVAADLVRAAPNVRIIATSREPLNIPGETTWAVPPLSLPEGTDEIGRSEAVRLFADRAARARPGFRLEGENAAAAARICRRLDGIPLAIELAAARVRALSPAQIAERLDDGVLRAGREAPARHRTLGAAIDWSHDLLTEEERVLFRRLGVFAGSFALETAEEVCAGDPLAQGDVMDLLVRLVERSLVVPEGDRYRLLDTIRHYARERLEASGEADGVRARHLAWCVGLGDRPDEMPWAAERAWRERVTRERDEIHAALDRAGATGNARLGLRLATSLESFWLQGHLSEGRAQVAAMLAAGGGDPAERARALHSAGVLAGRQGDRAEARARFEEALSMRRALDDPVELGDSLDSLAWVTDDPAEARPLFDEALQVARRSADPGLTIQALRSLGHNAWRRKDHDAAVAHWHEALEIARARADPRVVHLLIWIGELKRIGGDVDAGIAMLEEALDVAQRLENDRWVAEAHRALGLVRTVLGEYDRAGAHVERVLEITEASGDARGIAHALDQLGEVALARGDPKEARAILERSLALARETEEKPHVARVLATLAQSLLEEGDLDAAIGAQEERLSLHREMGGEAGIAWALLGLGTAARKAGDPDRARRCWREALATWERLGKEEQAAECREWLAELDGGAEPPP